MCPTITFKFQITKTVELFNVIYHLGRIHRYVGKLGPDRVGCQEQRTQTLQSPTSQIPLWNLCDVNLDTMSDVRKKPSDHLCLDQTEGLLCLLEQPGWDD